MPRPTSLTLPRRAKPILQTQLTFRALFAHDLGSKVYKPYRQTDFSKPWWEVDGLEFRMLGPASRIADADTRELHDACLVVHLRAGKRVCLFTGDASDTNLANVAATTTRICDDILHASHHGSLNGADLTFIKVCNATYTVVSTASGVHESVPHPTALKRYRDNTSGRVYRTDTDGSVMWAF